MALLMTSGKAREHKRVRSWSRAWLWALALFLAPIAGSSATPPPEYQVKAVFLFNFAQFVQWPTRAFSGPHAPLIIGILGEDPFGEYIDRLTAGEKIEEHSIQVRRYRSVDEVKDCHILFISRSESTRMEEILARLKGRSILTVGDTENFNRFGGMIRFVMENGKIRLRVNVLAARDVDLSISSKLLRPATIVTTEGE